MIEDVNTYFKHFGEAAVYYQTAETPVNIKAIFDLENFTDFSNRKNSNVYATVKAADVPGLKKNLVFTRTETGEIFKILGWLRDEKNKNLLQLELSEKAVG